MDKVLYNILIKLIKKYPDVLRDGNKKMIENFVENEFVNLDKILKSGEANKESIKNCRLIEYLIDVLEMFIAVTEEWVQKSKFLFIKY